jgi:nucleotide-binding universal stress UspA family protein
MDGSYRPICGASSLGDESNVRELEMIKTIFVPASGTQSDHSVFAAALAVARPLGAHLDFYHQRLSACEAALRLPPVQFCVGPAITQALDNLEQRDENLSTTAISHIKEFCAANKVSIRQDAGITDEMSASWMEETDQAEARLMIHARHSDLVVVGRQHTNNLMPYNFIEWLLLSSGRPILIAPDSKITRVTGTVVVGWKETAEAARALAAALPLLKRADRVVLVSVEEDQAAPISCLEHLAHQLQWHGIVAEPRICRDKSSPAVAQLNKVAGELRADLLVIGGYGHRPLREAVFGGVTRAFMEGADLPVFMVH